MRVRKLLFAVACASALAGCARTQEGTPAPAQSQGQSQAAAPANPYQPMPYVKLKHPEWAKNAVIYQINTRQFTHEGTFRAAA
jgi:ABC-type uncharacterized transport system auxiliary subunit